MSGAKIVIGERLRDQIEQILPSDPDSALSTLDLSRRLGADHNKVSHACSSLIRFKAAQKRYIRLNNTNQVLYWRVAP